MIITVDFSPETKFHTLPRGLGVYSSSLVSWRGSWRREVRGIGTLLPETKPWANLLLVPVPSPSQEKPQES